MKRILLLLAALLFSHPASAEQQQRPWGDAARELLARHPEWNAYDVSPHFVTLVPLGNGVVVKKTDGLPRKISETADIFLHSLTANADNSLRGELRFMKKDGKSDVLVAFKNLMKPEDDIISSFNSTLSGDSQKGIYTLVYILKNGDIIYEKIHNLHDDVAVSYRMMTRKKSNNKEIARDIMVFLPLDFVHADGRDPVEAAVLQAPFDNVFDRVKDLFPRGLKTFADLRPRQVPRPPGSLFYSARPRLALP